MKLKWMIDCKLFKKHRYSYFDNRCIVCGRLDPNKKTRHYT